MAKKSWKKYASGRSARQPGWRGGAGAGSQSSSDNSALIVNAYKEKNLKALEDSLANATKDTILKVLKDLKLPTGSATTLKGSKQMLLQAVAEANRRDTRK